MKISYSNKNNLTVVLHNSLINSNYSLKIDEIRLIYIALTKVDSRHSHIGTIDVYADEFAEIFNLSPKNIWRNMQNSSISIRDKTLKIKSLHSESEEELIKWFSICHYHRSSGNTHRIELRFSDSISPYLFELNKNFTKVKLNNIRKLKSPFSHRLYLWLIKEYKMRSGNYYDLKLLLKDIKEKLLIPTSSYTKWRDFKQRFLQPAIYSGLIEPDTLILDNNIH
ncbi:replication initiation protein, partial [Psychromonas aquatilis]